jgi:hypothetical protein
MENVQRNYIGGTWVPAGATTPNVNPSNLERIPVMFEHSRRVERSSCILGG